MTAISNAYECTFHLRRYHSLYYTLGSASFSSATIRNLLQRLSFIHDFYSEVELHDARILEFGGGPTIYSLISAAPYTREIVFTDINSQALEEIRRWKESQPDALDFSDVIGYVVGELEKRDPEECLRRTESLKKLITRLVKCDFRQPHELFEEDKNPQFDVVSVHFCLCCSASLDEYTSNLVKLSKLLRPGGYLLLSDALEERRKKVGDGIFSSSLFLTKDALLESIKQCGLEIHQVSLLEDSCTELSDTTKRITLAAKKPC
ncbi:nicotinamide N-methyltransferase-like [Corticium candelabrum]|uniref:nicotinamide N-methyltransferase-like n=1 Tax=Corticium candelabrum TaxID=121492 RepID=UPI002E265990|nr:nicotinamide N-methyltransferase-like [Corticium candelabrum]